MAFNEYKMHVIRHELGHWLVAGHLQFKRGGIRIKVLSNRYGFGHLGSAATYPMHDLTSTESMKIYAENRISILLSGVAAQLLFDSDASSARCEKLLDEYGADDKGKIEELTHIVRGIVNAGTMSMQNEIEQKNAIRVRCWETAARYLQERKSILEHMSLCVAAQVTQENVEYTFEYDQLCQWSDDGSGLEHYDDECADV